jgi:hypothetical protein
VGKDELSQLRAAFRMLLMGAAPAAIPDDLIRTLHTARRITILTGAASRLKRHPLSGALTGLWTRYRPEAWLGSLQRDPQRCGSGTPSAGNGRTGCPNLGITPSPRWRGVFHL